MMIIDQLSINVFHPSIIEVLFSNTTTAEKFSTREVSDQEVQFLDARNNNRGYV